MTKPGCKWSVASGLGSSPKRSQGCIKMNCYHLPNALLGITMFQELSNVLFLLISLKLAKRGHEIQL